MFLASWAVLMGPVQYAQHLVSGPRLPFTAAYFGAIAMTLYFAIGVSNSCFVFVFYWKWGWWPGWAGSLLEWSG
jgi:hypothetical protein